LADIERREEVLHVLLRKEMLFHFIRVIKIGDYFLLFAGEGGEGSELEMKEWITTLFVVIGASGLHMSGVC
jgi:hypothetical protein